MSRERLRRGLALAMAFCAAVALACAALTAVFARTLAREGYLDGALRRSGYYDELTQRIRDDCSEILTAAGLPEAQAGQVLDEYVTRDQVIAGVREHIAAWFDGYDSVNTAYFPQAVHWFLDLYWEGTADYPSPEVNLALIEAQASCETIFRDAVRVPFANAVSILLQYRQMIWPALGTEFVLLLAALAVLFRLSLDMREFLSCAAAGVSASGLGALLTSAVLLCSGYAGWRDPAEPDAAAFRMWFAGSPRGLLVAGVLLLAAGAAVLVRTQRAAEPVREESAAQAADAEPVREEPAPQEKQPSVRAAGAPIVKQPPARVWAHARAIGPARSVRTDRAAHIPQRKI